MRQATERFGADEQSAMVRALELAATPGVPFGPNPRVGCVLLDDQGAVVAEGHHRGAGAPHAEAEALGLAGDKARGSTAVVTLEPCNHTGRTPPCARALIEAGVRRVAFAQADPNAEAAGGAEALRRAGVEVVSGWSDCKAADLNRGWAHGLEHGRPLVTWKFATTLDGRSAAADGSSRWVSNREAREDTHRLRGLCDTMLIGTNSVAVDDPRLTVRDDQDRALPHQPLRVVMGERDLDPARKIFDGGPDGIEPETLHLRTRDPRAALHDLFDRGRRHVFLEGGPTLAAAFLRAGVVDEIVVYVAPMLLGSGASAVADLGIGTIADAFRPQVADIAVFDHVPGEDPNVRLILTPRKDS